MFTAELPEHERIRRHQADAVLRVQQPGSCRNPPVSPAVWRRSRRIRSCVPESMLHAAGDLYAQADTPIAPQTKTKRRKKTRGKRALSMSGISPSRWDGGSRAPRFARSTSRRSDQSSVPPLARGHRPWPTVRRAGERTDRDAQRRGAARTSRLFEPRLRAVCFAHARAALERSPPGDPAVWTGDQAFGRRSDYQVVESPRRTTFLHWPRFYSNFSQALLESEPGPISVRCLSGLRTALRRRRALLHALDENASRSTRRTIE